MFETADSGELNYRKQLRDAVLQTIGSSRFALYHHIVRREADADLGATFPDDFSARLDAAWQARLRGRKLYVNELYLTIVRRPLQGRVGLADFLRGWLGRAAAGDALRMRAELQQLDAAREALLAALGSYDPRVLSVYDGANGPCSEPLEFLSLLYNGETRPVLLPQQDLGAYLPYRRISFGQDAVELSSSGHAGRSFTAIVSIKDSCVR